MNSMEGRLDADFVDKIRLFPFDGGDLTKISLVLSTILALHEAQKIRSLDAARPVQTVADRVMTAIQTAIVTGDLAPGAKLKEPDLARAYGISRGPLREAIRRLEARRLVELTPHTGARVTELTLEQLLELYEAREALEGTAARLAADRMSSEELDDLKRLLELHAAVVEEKQGREYFQQEGDVDFHYRIAKASGNSIVSTILCKDLYHLMRMYRYKFSLVPDRPVAALKEHWRIMDALSDRDGELAELLMRRHIRKVRANIERSEQEEQRERVGDS